VVRLSNLTLTAGNDYLFTGQYTATSTIPDPIMMGVQIKCYGPANVNSVDTTKNHTGGSSQQAVAVNWLFEVATTGTYTCDVLGWAGQGGGKGALALVSGATATYITMQDAPELGGSEWRDASALNLSLNQSGYVLRKDWTASDTATTVDVLSAPEITTNGPKGTSSTVQTTLSVQQMNANGSTCGSPVTSVQNTTISATYHHYKVFHTLHVAVNGVCTSRNFAIKTLVEVTAGSPITVENGSYSSGIAMNN
jgi:hypothetical protein